MFNFRYVIGYKLTAHRVVKACWLRRGRGYGVRLGSLIFAIALHCSDLCEVGKIGLCYDVIRFLKYWVLVMMGVMLLG